MKMLTIYGITQAVNMSNENASTESLDYIQNNDLMRNKKLNLFKV